jgi:hypothetical protein
MPHKQGLESRSARRGPVLFTYTVHHIFGYDIRSGRPTEQGDKGVGQRGEDDPRLQEYEKPGVRFDMLVRADFSPCVPGAYLRAFWPHGGQCEGFLISSAIL